MSISKHLYLENKTFTCNIIYLWDFILSVHNQFEKSPLKEFAA